MAGSANLPATPMITSRRVPVSGLGVTTSPPSGSRANSVRTRSTSLALHGSGNYRYAHRLGCRFGCAQECQIGGYFWHVEDRDPTHARRDLLEHLQPFTAKR